MSPDRAAVVAAIRALADFVEARTDLTPPDRVLAQVSLPVPTPDNEVAVAVAAKALGVPARRIDDHVWCDYTVSATPLVRYAVTGVLR